MNSVSIILASIALSSVGAVVVSLALRPADTSPVTAASFADLQSTVAELTKANTALQGKLDAMSKQAAPAVMLENDRTAVPAVSNEQVAAAVEAYLKRRGNGNGEEAGLAANGAPAFDLDKDFKALIGTNYWQNAAAWKKAFAAGAMDEVIKKLEEMAKSNPNDIPTQMNLASAYMAYMQMDQSKWQNSIKADQVFDKVLELDNTHWEARFTKAMSYTFWPKFLGKTKEAISHFETLVSQQEKMPVEAHQAQTYLFLGNLLEEQGDTARAKEMWQKGARRHPDNQDLVKKAGR
jgi:tetratricopeptide (TPR) repeat protein